MLHMQNITVSFTLAVMFVLIGSVATELRWGGRHNFTFTRHEFLVVTVKEWLKLVYFYQSYRKSKLGVPLILDHPVCCRISPKQLLWAQRSLLQTVKWAGDVWLRRRDWKQFCGYYNKTEQIKWWWWWWWLSRPMYL